MLLFGLFNFAGGIGFNDGSLLSAHLTGGANVSKGDNITFLVKNISDNQISLKVVSVCSVPVDDILESFCTLISIRISILCIFI